MQDDGPGRERELHRDRAEGDLERKQGERDVGGGGRAVRRSGGRLPTQAPRERGQRGDKERYGESGEPVAVLDQRREIERREQSAVTKGPVLAAAQA